MAAARHEFWLDRKRADGMTNRESRRRADLKRRARGGRTPTRSEPTFPPGTEHLWAWFHELHASRSWTGFGPLPVTHRDIEAWISVSGWRPTPFEVELLREMDGAFLTALAADERGKKREERRGRRGPSEDEGDD